MAEQGTADPGPSAKTTPKAALVDAGTRLILEQGYHHTGIQDVLQAAGVPKGLLLLLFPEQRGVWVRGDCPVCGRLSGAPRAVLGTPPTAPSPVYAAIKKGCLPGLRAAVVGAGA